MKMELDEIDLNHSETTHLSISREEYERLMKERDALLTLCAELYQVLGAYDAPEHILDKVSAAMMGEAITNESLLPFSIW